MRLVGYPRVSTRGQVKTGASIPYQDRENPGVDPAQWPPHRRHVPGGRPQRRPRPRGPGRVDRRHRHDRRRQGRRAGLLQPGSAGPGDHCRRPSSPRSAMRKMAGVMYELDRRLVVARLRRGRRLKAERGGFAGGGVRYGLTTECKQLVPDQAERNVARRIRRLHRGGLSIRTLPTSSTPSRSQPNAAAPGTDHRRPDPSEDSMSTFWQAVRRGARSAGPTRSPRRTGGRPPVGEGWSANRSEPTTAPQDRTIAPSLLAGCHVIQRTPSAVSRHAPTPQAPVCGPQRATHGSGQGSLGGPPLVETDSDLGRPLAEPL